MAVKLGAVLLAVAAVLLPLAAHLGGGTDVEVARTCAVGGALLVLSAAMMATLARALRDRAFDDGLSANPFAPLMNVDLQRPTAGRITTPARESRSVERTTVETRAR